MSNDQNWHFHLLNNEPALEILVHLLGQLQTYKLLSVCKNNMRHHFLANKFTVTVCTLEDLNAALGLHCKRIHIAEKLDLPAAKIDGNFVFLLVVSEKKHIPKI